MVSSCEQSESGIQTPLSSVCDGFPIDPEICSRKPLQPDHDDFVIVDITDDIGIRQPDCFVPVSSRDVYTSLDATAPDSHQMR